MHKPALLYFCDFPPSNFAGGPVLVKRLLEGYPSEKVTILTGSHYLKSAPRQERLACSHIVFPTSNETGRWGLGRIKFFCSWLLIPLLTLVGVWALKRRELKVILTVADGHFFIAAACVSMLTSTPLVLIVHDDWVAAQKWDSYVIRYFCGALFRFVIRRSSHIYAVSPGMQNMLRDEYQTESELQLPATEIHEIDSSAATAEVKPETFRIVFAGIGSGAVLEGLNLIVQVIKSGTLAALGLKACELHLYMAAGPDDARRLGWEHEDIKLRGWVSQNELRSALKTAHLLFLPYSFRDDQRFFTTRSFPSKVADYLASGTPILILSPAYASIVEYASRHGFAEIVDEPTEAALAKGIFRIWSDRNYRERLGKNAGRVLNMNHNIKTQRINFQQIVYQLASGLSSETPPNVLVTNQ